MKSSKTFILGLGLLIVVSVVVGLSVRQILAANTEYLVELVDVQHAPAEIGGGGCSAYLYDSQGNTVDCSIIIRAGAKPDYVGSAPLYLLNTSEVYDTLEDHGKSIDPLVARQGSTIYPLVFSVHTPSEKVAVGESSEIAVEANLLDHFPNEHEKGIVAAVPFSLTVPVTVSFFLSTTTFDFTPVSPGSADKKLDLNWPALESWIISPKEGILGDQILIASVHSQNFVVGTKVFLRVQSLTGVNPKLGAILGTVGTFLLGLFGLMKIVPEIVIKFREAMKSEGVQNKDKNKSVRFE